MEADTHNTHGLIALIEGTEESARRAVAYFEMYLKVCKTIGDDEGIAVAKRNIAIAKSKYESDSNEEVLEASQELYELRIAEYGDGNEQTIEAGKFYAIRLCKANRGDEARELLTKLLATSKQVLGPHHSTTKEVESALEQVVDIWTCNVCQATFDNYFDAEEHEKECAIVNNLQGIPPPSSEDSDISDNFSVPLISLPHLYEVSIQTIHKGK
jgi:hypothetical protein